MYLTEEVWVTINPSNFRHYQQFYPEIKVKEQLKINVTELTKGSKVKIKVKCDECGVEKELAYKNYQKYGYEDGSYFCKKCKTRLNNLKNYGVVSTLQRKDVVQKIKQTNLERYGVENVSQNKEIQQRKIQTNLEKYGVEWGLSNEEIRQKAQQTIKEEYGVENVSQNSEIKKKKEETCLNNHGVKYITQSEKYQKELHQKNLEKYGVPHFFLTEECQRFKQEKQIELLKTKFGDLWLGINDTNFHLKCDQGKDHDFIIDSRNLHQRHFRYKVPLCTICNPIGVSFQSEREKELLKFITTHYDSEIINNSKKVIPPLELDIYLPELKLAFEFNGLWWHNELYKDKKHHYNKTEVCEDQGIHLIHIYEDDWLYKREIIESRILNLLGQSQRIYARKCEIRELKDNKLIRRFLERNHIQGFVGSKVKLGLFYDEELVSLMTLGKKRKAMNSKSKEGEWELLRFCNQRGLNVVGGASKLFKYFVRNYQPKEVISYADRSWSQGGLYEKLGFSLVNKTPPNYYYVVDGLRRYRFNYRKDKLVKAGYDPQKSEHEIMLERGLYRIYDSGSLKYVYS